ncbi:MAG: 5-bromo-4-chloroindolyl phosphate hydrolysis family protein [Oscillospiraceae bacterium]|nr:5-bromo-4-chloroindolyl phosphate hydrolysis family protein [Oscillospiraceae bacterium]
MIWCDLREVAIADAIRKKKNAIAAWSVAVVIFAGISIWLLFIISSWWSILLGIPLSLLSLLCLIGTCIERGHIKKFKKYIPFYDRGDVFLDQIAVQINSPLSSLAIKDELETLVKENMLANLAIYKETGQIIIASLRNHDIADNFTKYIPFYNKGQVSFSDVKVHVGITMPEIRIELQSLARFGAIETPVIDEATSTILIRTIFPLTLSAQTGNDVIDALLQNGETAVATFRRLRKSIPDAQVGEKIGELIAVTESIFQRLSNEPESYDQVRRFANYYLPKAQKLLTSYESLINSSQQSEHVSNMLDRINATLDPLVAGFKGIYNSLYLHKALDIETDIEVLELMLKQDGIHEKSDFHEP